MKKLVLVLTLAAFALTGAAFAQDPAWQDNIGIYADEGALENCATVGVDTPLNLYLVLSKATAGEVLGWEAKLTYINMLELSFSPRGDDVDAGNIAGEHIVGLAAPMPVLGGTVVLADIQVMVNQFLNDPLAPSYIVIDPVFFHTLAEAAPAYLDGAGDAHRMYPSTIDGHEGGAVFFVNNGCDPVAVDQDTWGGLKSLYR